MGISEKLFNWKLLASPHRNMEECITQGPESWSAFHWLSESIWYCESYHLAGKTKSHWYIRWPVFLAWWLHVCMQTVCAIIRISVRVQNNQIWSAPGFYTRTEIIFDFSKRSSRIDNKWRSIHVCWWYDNFYNQQKYWQYHLDATIRIRPGVRLVSV